MMKKKDAMSYHRKGRNESQKHGEGEGKGEGKAKASHPWVKRVIYKHNSRGPLCVALRGRPLCFTAADATKEP